MSEITKDVILDLLPLYLAGEVSADTSALVKRYLDTDPELAKQVDDMSEKYNLGEVPVPLRKDIEMEAYKKANVWMVIRTLGLAAIITGFILCILLIIPMIIIMFVP